MASYRTEEYLDQLECSARDDFVLSEAGALTSIALSLKRIADALDSQANLAATAAAYAPATHDLRDIDA